MDNTEQADTAPVVSELEVLKNRARLMNITFSNNISVEKLKAKIDEKMSEESNLQPVADMGSLPAVEREAQPNALEVGAEIADAKHTTPDIGSYNPDLDHDKNGKNGGVAPAKPLTLRQQQQQEQLRLVRIRIQCLDPKKKDLPGEIITLANEVIGTVRKFVPYGEVTDDGYHVPFFIYRHLEKRKFLNIRTGKDRKTGTPTVSSNWAKEFSIEVLDPLTPEELSRLANAQAAAGSIN